MVKCSICGEQVLAVSKIRPGEIPGYYNIKERSKWE